MRNAGLEEAQAGNKIAGRNINNPQICRGHHPYGRKWRTKDPLDESETGEWKSWLKLNIQRTKVMASVSIISWQVDGEIRETVTDFIFRCSKITAEKAMAPYSSTLAWKIPWMEDPGRLQSMRSLRVGHDWATSFSLFTFMHCRRKWQPTPVFLPGESQRQRSLVGCRLWGHTVRHNWSDLAAAAAAAAAAEFLPQGITHYPDLHFCFFLPHLKTPLMTLSWPE